MRRQLRGYVFHHSVFFFLRLFLSINSCLLILILILALLQRKAEEELAAQWAADKAARDYALLDQVDDEDEDGEASRPKTVQEMMDDFM